MLRADNLDPLVKGDLSRLQVLVMELVGRGYFPADPVTAWNSDVDLGRVNVAQLV
jgi:hypothetical protein